MVEILASYNVKGNYQFRGTTGTQEGELHICTDGKIVGLLQDNDRDGFGIGLKKYILGSLWEKRNKIIFLKIPEFSAGVLPVLWAMDKKAGFRSDEGLGRIYDGFWMTGQGMPMQYELQQSVESEKPTVEQLAQIDREMIEKIYFSGHVVDYIESGRKLGQSGTLNLELIKTK